MKVNRIIEYLKMAISYLRKNGIKKTVKFIKKKLFVYRSYHNFNSNYNKWIENNEPNESDIDKQKNFSFKVNPKISIVIPMYNTNLEFFRELVDSIKNQTYTNFEVCLADGSENINEDILKLINDDKRFNYKYLNQNLGISNNTNAAINMVTGDFIALVDHDDLLPKFALYEVVKSINNNQDVDFIYSDEDIIDIKGNRKNPHFKPDFSPDTLRSYNYICHLSVIKMELLKQVGNFDSNFDGSQDYDLILRVTEKARKIVHIPKILYHWRAHENSTAQNTNSKLYVFDAAKKALEAHLKRLNLNGKVNILDVPGTYKVEYFINNNPKISIIIPNKDEVSTLKRCIDSILKSTYNNFEIIVVENNSVIEETFNYYKLIEENEKIKVIYYKEKGFNFSKINNFARDHVTGEYILFLNNDTEVINPDWLEEMLGICQRDDVGIVGSKLLYFDNTVQHAGVIVGMGGVAGHINTNIKDEDPGYFSRANIINNFSAVTAACMLIKTKIFDEIGGFNENLQVAFNDIDLCMRVRRKNYLVVYTPYSKLYHYESKSRGYEDTPEKKKRFAGEIRTFKDEWAVELESGDPYFNRNFRLDKASFQIDVRKKD